MKKTFTRMFAMAFAFFMTQGIQAQESNVVFEETFHEDLGAFTLQGYTGSSAGNVWTHYGSSVDFAQAYINNTLCDRSVNPNPVCLLQSPQVVLGNDNYLATFDQYNVWFVDVTTEIGLLIREVGSTDWETLECPVMKVAEYPLSSVGNIVIPETYKNKTVEFAFKYAPTPVEEDFSNAGVWYINNFKVWASATTEKADPKISFPEAIYEVVYEEGFTAPELDNPNNVEVKYSSSNPDVAVVDEATGEVSLVGGGSTIITAQSVENDYFRASTASYELIVNKEMEYNDIFVETFANGFNGFTVEGYNGNEKSVWTMNGSYAQADAFGLVDEPFTNYLVSPVFLLDGTSCIAKFDYSAKYFADDEVMNQMAFSIREEGGQWEDLIMPVCQNSETFISSDMIEIPETYNGKNVQVAFKYSAVSNNSAGCWMVTNLYVQAPAVPTGINNVNAEKVSNKIYDLQGREVKNPAHGLYIVNGKKVIIK